MKLNTKSHYTNDEYALLFREGDEIALNFFYQELHPALSFYANRWVSDRSIAEDIASEAIVRTWKHHFKFDSYQGIKSYLYLATERLSQRYAGKEKKRLKVHAEIFSFADKVETPFDHLVRTETAALVRAALKALPPSTQKVLTMHFIQGKKLHEIADELGLADSTVSVQKKQGLEALRKKFLRPLMFSLLSILLNWI